MDYATTANYDSPEMDARTEQDLREAIAEASLKVALRDALAVLSEDAVMGMVMEVLGEYVAANGDASDEF